MSDLTLSPADGITVSWDLDAAREGSERPWRLEGSLAPSYSALRVLTALTQSGDLLLLAAARPTDADGHDAESPTALIVEMSGKEIAMDESLLSTQYSGDGSLRRVGLELYPEGDDYPIRAAGDIESSAVSEEDGLRVERATAPFRLDGAPATVVYEILQA